MKTLLVAAATLPLLGLCLAPASAATVNENQHRVTLTCHGEDITINGNRNMITLRGACRRLTVAGNSNMVTTDAVGTIETPGNSNTVVWSGKKSPKVTNLGNGNTIARAKPRKR